MEIRLDHCVIHVSDRALAAALFLAGLARASGWLVAGKPHPLQRGLLVIELAAPSAIVAWQKRLASRR